MRGLVRQRRQYEVNYLNARKQMGRKRAELLFPKKNKARAAVEVDTEDEMQVNRAKNKTLT